MPRWGERVLGGRDEIGLIALLGTVQVETLVLVDPEVCGSPAAAEDGLGSGGVVDPVDQEAIIDVHGTTSPMVSHAVVLWPDASHRLMIWLWRHSNETGEAATRGASMSTEATDSTPARSNSSTSSAVEVAIHLGGERAAD